MRTNRIFRPDAGGGRRPALIGLALLVAACAAPDGSPGSNGAADAGANTDANSEAGAATTAPRPDPKAPAAPNGADGTTALAPGVRTVGAQRQRRFDPEEFVGYEPEKLLPVLGAPDFVRRDGPAQIWQYRAENCVFDLFLYREGDTSRVSHVELRERGATDVSAETCFVRMRSERKPKPAG